MGIRLSIKLTSIIMAVFLLIFLARPAWASGVGGELYLTANNNWQVPGSSLTVTLHEDSDVSSINVAQANISYDPAQLSVQSVNAASGWSEAHKDTSTPGTIIFAAFPSPAGTSLSGDQAVANIVFQVNTVGASTVSFGCSYNVSTCINGNALTKSSDNSIILPLLASLTLNINHLTSTQTLAAGQSLTSPNAMFWLVMQGDGNLVLYGGNLRPIWNSRTSGSGANRVVMQGDGNLVLYTASNRAVWTSNTAGTGPSNLFLQDDGNLVLYKAGGQPTWYTGTSGTPTQTYFGSDRLLPNQALPAGNYIRSADSRYALLLQGDGNLVLYSSGYHVLWASDTSGRGVNKLVMQGDGNLVLYTVSNVPVWFTSTHGNGSSRLILQTDGNLVIYKSNFIPTWASNTSGRF